MSPVKEPHFFAFEDGDEDFLGSKLNPEKMYIWQNHVNNKSEYEKLFERVTGETAIGEASTLYLYLPKCPGIIKKYLPNVRLIAILRNPVDRCYSQYLHSVHRKYEPYFNDFKRALSEEEKRIKDGWGVQFYYKDLGFYFAQLKRYYNFFKKSQIKIYLFEELCANPQILLKDAFAYLQVDESFIPNISEKYNVSGVPQDKILWYFFKKAYQIRSFLKILIPSGLRKYIAYKTYKSLYRKTHKPDFSEELRKQLIEVYRDDILKLQDLINKDLSIWLK
jgi:hypothetical protein